MVRFGHDESSQTNAAKGTFCVEAASVDAGDVHAVHAVLALVNVCPHNKYLWLLSGKTEADVHQEALTCTRHAGHVQLVSMVTVTGVSLRDPDAAAVLTAVQDPTVLGGAHAAVRLVTSWWTTEETSAVWLSFQGSKHGGASLS